MPKTSITVIYDGDCDLCKASITWLAKKLVFTALPFQTSDLAPFGLTKEECSQSVYAIRDETTYSAANAVAFLLYHRGKKALSTLIKLSGPIGNWSYTWVATHRHTKFMKLVTRFLNWINSRN